MLLRPLLTLPLALFLVGCLGATDAAPQAPTPTPPATMPTLEELLAAFEAEYPQLTKPEIRRLREQMASDQFIGGGLVSTGNIEPGIYRAETPETCYWDAKGQGGNRGGGRSLWDENPKQPVYARIYATDYSFSSRGCGTWVKVW